MESSRLQKHGMKYWKGEAKEDKEAPSKYARARRVNGGKQRRDIKRQADTLDWNVLWRRAE